MGILEVSTIAHIALNSWALGEPRALDAYMSYSLNSLKGIIWGDYYRGY